MSGELTRRSFSQIPLTDQFFDSLRGDYPGFDEWFLTKAAEPAYVFTTDSGEIEGFLYLKEEEGAVTDVHPPFRAAKRIKIGTFKVLPHGTRLGERFMKKALDHAVAANVHGVYVTVFPKHARLIDIFMRYGFKKVAEKHGPGGVEDVYARPLWAKTGDLLHDYPLMHRHNVRKYMLSIYPAWHTRLLPDSKLNNEPPDIIEDVSHTNSIHKVYLTSMSGTEQLRRGDLLALYRTTDGAAPAHYRSVITSAGVVEEVRDLSSFTTIEELLAYCAPYSVFTEEELREFWRSRKYRTFIRFTYNVALRRRVTRGELIDQNIIDPKAYAGFMELTDQQFGAILQLGDVDARLVVD
jgi:L-amino acid N-acyltransferase YncA